MAFFEAPSPAFRGRFGHAADQLLSLFAWALCLGFLAWAARLDYLEGYVYEIPKQFSGDFIQTARLAFPWWFDGTNIFYGPVFVLEYRMLFAPNVLQPIDFARADFVLLGIAFVCTWLAVFGWRRPRLAVLVLALWLAHHATVEALANTSHLEILELAAIALALLLAVRRRATAAGLALGFAVGTKTLPAIFLPYLVLTRRWAMLASAAVVSGGLLLVVCWLQRVPPWEGALALLDQRGNLTDIEFTEYAYTLRADVARVLAGGAGVLSPDQARTAITVHWVVAVAVMLAVAVVLARARPAGRHYGLFYGVIAATMLVVAPSAHAAYYIFVLPGLTAGLAEILDRDMSLDTLGAGVALGAGFVLTGFDQPFIVCQRVLGVGGVVPSHWLTWHLPTLGLLATVGGLCALLLTTNRSQPIVRGSKVVAPAGGVLDSAASA